MAPDEQGSGIGHRLSVVLVTRNPGKVKEIRLILAGGPLDLVALEELGDMPPVEETGETYLENALLKARSAAEFFRLPTLADDSGLEVDALLRAPGPRSARFAGAGSTDAKNNALLACLMTSVPAQQRGARYRCVAAICFPDGDLAPGHPSAGDLAAVAICEGSIAAEPRGEGGFGYDPWFVPRGFDRTMAQLDPQEKNSISHRARAMRAIGYLLSRRI